MIEAWQAIAGIAASGVVVGTAVFEGARRVLRSDFVPRGTHAALEGRVNGLEKRVQTLPNEGDLANLNTRLHSVETGVAVVQTTVDGVNAGMKRVERTVSQLLEHALQREKS